jgi:autotransporter-associated beta strand protein
VAICAAAIAAMPAVSRAGALDDIGVTTLRARDATLNGAGVRVGQPEADEYGVTDECEVNPSLFPYQTFTYINSTGASGLGGGTVSSHADSVASNFYQSNGTTSSSGAAWGITKVDGYEANYYFNHFIANGIATPNADAVVNQSFGFGTLSISDEQVVDLDYDNYTDLYGTIFVSAIGNPPGTVDAPGTSYNCIAVGASQAGGYVTGPTPDNGRSKPDLIAPSSLDSFALPFVSGSAAILIQAGARGDGGSGALTESYAVDERTIKALLLNGAVKPSDWTHTQTAPLDTRYGSGIVNVNNADLELNGQIHHGVSATTSSVGGAHPANTSAPISSLLGWDFVPNITTSATSDAYRNYTFTPGASAGVNSYTLTATLVWNRPYNSSSTNAINNLDLFLYDVTTSTATAIDLSKSTVDNVQQLYDVGLNPNDTYTIEAFKNGGSSSPGTPGVISDTETYAFAYSFVANPGIITTQWQNAAGGSWSITNNWQSNIGADSLSAVATFGSVLSGAQSVTLDGNKTVGALTFASPYSYTINAGIGGSLQFNNGAGSAQINDLQGTHTLNVPITLASNLNVSVNNATDQFNITGAIGGSFGLAMSGSGTLRLSGANTYSGATTISGGSTLILATTSASSNTPGAVVNNGTLNITGTASVGTISGTGTLTIGSAGSLMLAENQSVSTVNGFSLAPGGNLDVSNNALLIHYSAAGQPSPDAAIRAALIAGSGTNGVTYNGVGIMSSTAARLNAALVANGGTPKYGVGYADGSDPYLNNEGPAAGTEEVKLTLLGDLNLDGFVNSADFILFANSFGQSGGSAAAWDHGDLNYDGSVNSADFILFADNFGQTLGTVSSTSGGLTLAQGGLDAAQVQQFNAIGADLGISSTELAGLDLKVAAVPEPASFGILVVGSIGLMSRRRRRA